MNETPTLDDVQRARTRIRDYVRLTPLIPALPAKAPLFAEGRLSLKLECLQIVGSFKARGASAKLTSLDEAAVRRGLVTASGGNHGLGVAARTPLAGRALAVRIHQTVAVVVDAVAELFRLGIHRGPGVIAVLVGCKSIAVGIDGLGGDYR